MDETPDRILFCTSCGVPLRWIDPVATVRDHQVQGLQTTPLCIGSGSLGVDLGPRHGYWAEGSRLIYEGTSDDETIRIGCPNCDEERPFRLPPDGAFARKSPVHVECRRCSEQVRVAGYREGPQGIWVPR